MYLFCPQDVAIWKVKKCLFIWHRTHLARERKMTVSTVFSSIFCTLILFLSAHTIWNVMWFLSSNGMVENSHLESNSILFPLWCNANLILMFILQHSFLKTQQIASYVSQTWARSFYTICTCLVLQVYRILEHLLWIS